ncbi:outer membrane protein assembly factor BamD [Acidocella sp.]|uniref:outer membrane protein assembly factor BamD n=1 Tax=Acidocella sp. TaxID=50710 RepID=UPI00260781A3|nr:outer membrane protein assembly factor BamD [Acidocella sp.]MDD2795600.1 outer membrane protein assembly factor BamD [Acidocella sp.]
MTNFHAASLRTSLPALALLLCLGGCSALESSKPRDTGDYASSATLPPADVLYAQGVAQTQHGYYEKAVKLFNEVDENYPYSTWATHAELLAGYSQYKEQNYDDAISSLNRYISLHPEDADAAYAYYLKSLCYYEQIDDVQRDQTTTYEAIQTLNDVITRFPNSSYALDARIKLRLANNRLAGHDMVIGRFYEQQHLYGAAIGRYQDIVTSFQTTTYTPEALERLVECYLNLGLTGAAQRTASVLGYNYPGSSWYQSAYNTLKAHHLLAPPPVAGTDQSGAAAPNQSGAATGASATTPPADTTQSAPATKKHHWYWPF